MEKEFDWKKGWEVFRERFGKVAPDVMELEKLIWLRFEVIWRNTVPLVGVEQSADFCVDKDGKLKATWMGWLLLDVITAVAISEATRRAKEDLDKALAKLEKRINDKLKGYVKFPG